MTALLVGAVAVVAVPLAVGVVLGSILPGVGRLRAEVGPWHLLHLLWIYPVLYLAGSLGEGISRFVVRYRLRRNQKLNKVQLDLVEFLVAWIGLSACFSVFFEHSIGAAIAAAVALLCFVPYVRLLERRPEHSDDDTASEE